MVDERADRSRKDEQSITSRSVRVQSDIRAFHLAVLLEFCQQLSGTASLMTSHSSSVCFSRFYLGYLSHGTSVHYGR